MRRITITGLSVLAALAVGATGASSALAAEYGRCAKAEKETVEWKEGPAGKEKTKKKAVYTGAYVNKGCTKEAPASGPTREKGSNPGPEGKYEWLSGAVQAGFSVSSKQTTLTGKAGAIACKKSVSTGTITTSDTATEQITFEECSEGGAPCTTVREDESGEWVETGTEDDIKTYYLDAMLVDHGTALEQLNEAGEPEQLVEPAEGEVWTLVEPGSEGPYEAAYSCKGVGVFWTSGVVAGVTSPTDEMEKKLTTVFEGGKGVQDLFTEAQLSGDMHEGAIPIGRGIQKSTDSQEGEEKLELRRNA